MRDENLKRFGYWSRLKTLWVLHTLCLPQSTTPGVNQGFLKKGSLFFGVAESMEHAPKISQFESNLKLSRNISITLQTNM